MGDTSHEMAALLRACEAAGNRANALLDATENGCLHIESLDSAALQHLATLTSSADGTLSTAVAECSTWLNAHALEAEDADQQGADDDHEQEDDFFGGWTTTSRGAPNNNSALSDDITTAHRELCRKLQRAQNLSATLRSRMVVVNAEEEAASAALRQRQQQRQQQQQQFFQSQTLPPPPRHTAPPHDSNTTSSTRPTIATPPLLGSISLLPARHLGSIPTLQSSLGPSIGRLLVPPPPLQHSQQPAANSLAAATTSVVAGAPTKPAAASVPAISAATAAPASGTKTTSSVAQIGPVLRKLQPPAPLRGSLPASVSGVDAATTSAPTAALSVPSSAPISAPPVIVGAAGSGAAHVPTSALASDWLPAHVDMAAFSAMHPGGFHREVVPPGIASGPAAPQSLAASQSLLFQGGVARSMAGRLAPPPLLQRPTAPALLLPPPPLLRPLQHAASSGASSLLTGGAVGDVVAESATHSFQLLVPSGKSAPFASQPQQQVLPPQSNVGVPVAAGGSGANSRYGFPLNIEGRAQSTASMLPGRVDTEGGHFFRGSSNGWGGSDDARSGGAKNGSPESLVCGPHRSRGGSIAELASGGIVSLSIEGSEGEISAVGSLKQPATDSPVLGYSVAASPSPLPASSVLLGGSSSAAPCEHHQLPLSATPYHAPPLHREALGGAVRGSGGAQHASMVLRLYDASVPQSGPPTAPLHQLQLSPPPAQQQQQQHLHLLQPAVSDAASSLPLAASVLRTDAAAVPATSPLVTTPTDPTAKTPDIIPLSAVAPAALSAEAAKDIAAPLFSAGPAHGATAAVSSLSSAPENIPSDATQRGTTSGDLHGDSSAPTALPSSSADATPTSSADLITGGGLGVLRRHLDLPPHFADLLLHGGTLPHPSQDGADDLGDAGEMGELGQMQRAEGRIGQHGGPEGTVGLEEGYDFYDDEALHRSVTGNTTPTSLSSLSSARALHAAHPYAHTVVLHHQSGSGGGSGELFNSALLDGLQSRGESLAGGGDDGESVISGRGADSSVHSSGSVISARQPQPAYDGGGGGGHGGGGNGESSGSIGSDGGMRGDIGGPDTQPQQPLKGTKATAAVPGVNLFGLPTCLEDEGGTEATGRTTYSVDNASVSTRGPHAFLRQPLLSQLGATSSRSTSSVGSSSGGGGGGSQRGVLGRHGSGSSLVSPPPLASRRIVALQPQVLLPSLPEDHPPLSPPSQQQQRQQADLSSSYSSSSGTDGAAALTTSGVGVLGVSFSANSGSDPLAAGASSIPEPTIHKLSVRSGADILAFIRMAATSAFTTAAAPTTTVEEEAAVDGTDSTSTSPLLLAATAPAAPSSLSLTPRDSQADAAPGLPAAVETTTDSSLPAKLVTRRRVNGATNSGGSGVSARAQLLGTSSSSSTGVTRRAGGGGTQSVGALDAVSLDNSAEQAELSSEMEGLAAQLKAASQAMHDQLKKDNTVSVCV